MRDSQKGVLLIILSALAYSYGAIFVKLAYAGGVNMLTALAGRFLLASVIIGVVSAILRVPLVLTGSSLLSMIRLAAVYIPTAFLFFAGVMFIPASLAILVLYTYPVMVSVYEVVVYGYPLTVRKAAAIILCLAGLAVVLGGADGPVNILGVVLELGCALFYAAYLLYGKKITAGYHFLTTTTYLLGLSALVFITAGLVTGGLYTGFPAFSWIWVAALAIGPTSLGIMFLFAGIKRIEAGKAAVISTIEPFNTVIFSAILLGETMTLQQVLGGIGIIAGIIIIQREEGKAFGVERKI